MSELFNGFTDGVKWGLLIGFVTWFLPWSVTRIRYLLTSIIR